MSNFSKWLGAGIGFAAGGVIGAVIGFAAGSVVDAYTKEDFEQERQAFEREYRRAPQQTRSGDFEISLLVLAAIVIKADGKIDERELNFVRSQFVGMYGRERANNAFKLFKGIMKKQISERQVCMQIRENMPH